nr:hypothetical protein DA06_05205 [Georgenia sp. SUBG003]
MTTEQATLEPVTVEPATATARALVTALVAHGVHDFVLAPGSRSAPFAYALQEAERAGWLRLHVRVDERAAGFVALGLSRAGSAAARRAERVPTGETRPRRARRRRVRRYS